MCSTRSKRRRIARLVEVIESGGDAAALVAKLRELEARQQAILEKFSGLQPVALLAPDVVENRLAEWRRLLRQSTPQSRAVLQRVLRGRITFTPRIDGQGYDFSCSARFDKLFSGVASPIPAWMERCDGRATPGVTADDTFDGDYGKLLEKAYQSAAAAGSGINAKCLASPGGLSTFSTPDPSRLKGRAVRLA